MMTLKNKIMIYEFNELCANNKMKNEYNYINILLIFIYFSIIKQLILPIKKTNKGIGINNSCKKSINTKF